MPETEVIIPKRAFLPCYHHLLDDGPNADADIHFLWGSRDSGKSDFIAARLIYKCLNAQKFRCILVKQTFESIKDAQWQTIKDVVERWGLESLFTFKTSPLEIDCVNGNKFIARGCDNPGKLKSIKDPTDAWYEEGNQISHSDFITISTTLRSNDVKVQQWFSFNPECKGNYEDFWLYKTYFKDSVSKGVYSFVSTTTWDIPGTDEKVPITYTSTHTTYHQNKFVSPTRKALLEQLKVTNPYYYNVYAKGLWGNMINENPFVYAFDRGKHLGTVELNRKLPVILSFDFNKNPITCLVGQQTGHMAYRGKEQIKLANSDIYKLCDYINAHYPGFLFIVTGDATGKNTSALVQDDRNYYTTIKTQLRLGGGQFKVPKSNPKIKENQVLVNAVLQMGDFLFDPEGCKGLIFDFENVSMLPTGEIDKSNRNDPAMQADALDCFRYMSNVFYPHVLKMVEQPKK